MFNGGSQPRLGAWYSHMPRFLGLGTVMVCQAWIQKEYFVGDVWPVRNCRWITVEARYALHQCFSTAGPRPGTGPWHQFYLAARDSPGIDN